MPFRHLWYGDGANWLCRLDPDVDTASATRTLNINTCVQFVFGAQFKPGQLAFDPTNNKIYAVDIQAKTQGIFRLHCRARSPSSRCQPAPAPAALSRPAPPAARLAAP